MRPACPPLLFGCKYLNFSRSTSELELITRRIINEEEGGVVSRDVLDDYADPDSDRYAVMLEKIRQQQHFTTLAYNRLDDLLEAAALDPETLCTYCWDGRE